jgi:hypothetical protein
VFLASLPVDFDPVVFGDGSREDSHDVGGYRVEPAGRDDARFSWPHDTDEARVVGGLDELH